ncbi:hypothetical protein IAT38_007341 [Cryptococcus sp. DSM 104549]
MPHDGSKKPAIPQLNPELWSLVLSYCLVPVVRRDERNFMNGIYQSQETLATAMRVNSTFYLAAAPILYRHAVVYDIGNLFLGANNPVSPEVLCLPQGVDSDLEYLREGNTKLPLLRHIRSITTIPREFSDLAPVHAIAAQSRSIDLADYIIQHILHTPRPSGAVPFMPHFNIITFDTALRSDCPLLIESDNCVRDEFYIAVSAIIPNLLRAGPQRKALCQTDSPCISCVRAVDWLDRAVPRVTTIHTQLQEEIELQLGTKTRVYVDWALHEYDPDDSEEDDDEEPPRMGKMSFSSAVAFMVDMLSDSIPDWLTEESAVSTGIMANTSIEVYGLENIVTLEDWAAFSEDEDDDDDDEGESKERKQMRRMLEDMEIQVYEEFQDVGAEEKGENRTFKLLFADEAPPCEACGRTPVLGPIEYE